MESLMEVLVKDEPMDNSGRSGNDIGQFLCDGGQFDSNLLPGVRNMYSSSKIEISISSDCEDINASGMGGIFDEDQSHEASFVNNSALSSSGSSSSSISCSSSSSSSLNVTGTKRKNHEEFEVCDGKSSNSSSDNASGTVFIVHDLSITSSAATEASLLLVPRPRHLPDRHPEFPSLSPEFLAHFASWADYGINRNRKVTSRMQAVMADMEKVLEDDPYAKFVVFSQHIESLIAVEHMLRAPDGPRGDHQAPYDCVTVGVKEPARERERNISRFCDDTHCNVCLIATGVAATGLTLTVARVCYFLEPTHNAAEEAQVLAFFSNCVL